MIVLLFVFALFLLRLFYSIAEIVFERDWPRHTWKGLMYSFLLFVLCVTTFV